MPRKLPWLDGASKKETNRATPAPQKSKKRSSSPDRLVDSDLDDIVPPQRSAVPKKRRQREPSSSPPPTEAPAAEYMREGLTADDIYVMVEDEFYSTAQLFTAPLHRAAYDRLKRLHRSRGAETLANLERATDSRTKVGTALRRKMEAKERRGKSVPQDEESDDDDEYMAVPELAGLMTSSQMIGERRGMEGIAKAKSNTRAAAGYLQSPHKGNKTKDVFANENVARVEEDETTDDDDLDAGTTQARVWEDMDTSLDEPRDSIEKPPEAKSKTNGFFKQFANKPESGHTRPVEPSKKSGPAPTTDESMSRELSCTPAGNGVPRRGGGGKGSRMAEILAKRRQATQAPDPPVAAVQETPVKNKTIKHEPVSTPRRNDDPETSPTNHKVESKSWDYLTQRKIKCEKKEPAEKSRNTQREDIPTFLF